MPNVPTICTRIAIEAVSERTCPVTPERPFAGPGKFDAGVFQCLPCPDSRRCLALSVIRAGRAGDNRCQSGRSAWCLVWRFGMPFSAAIIGY
jgi:hypothetical protein